MVTTIAADYSGMACDLQMTHTGGLKMKCKTKVVDVSPDVSMALFNTKRALVGMCGNADQFATVFEYFSNPGNYKKPPKLTGIEMMLLTGEKKIFHATNLSNWTCIDTKQLAIGSGSHFAIGAMTSGKTPLEAVKIASKLDPSTGMGFKEYKL